MKPERGPRPPLNLSDRRVEYVYLREIVNQADWAQSALHAVRSALSSEGGSPAGRVHDHIADFLNHAAVISKLLMPPASNPAARERVRGRHLRSALGMDGHPILDRRLRNLLEHLDERLDEWAEGAADRSGISLLDTGVGPMRAIVADQGVSLPPAIRWFDPDTSTYTVFGRDYDLQAIVEAVEDARRRAVDLLVAREIEGQPDLSSRLRVRAEEAIRWKFERSGRRRTVEVHAELGAARGVVSAILRDHAPLATLFPELARGLLLEAASLNGRAGMLGHDPADVLATLGRIGKLCREAPLGARQTWLQWIVAEVDNALGLAEQVASSSKVGRSD